MPDTPSTLVSRRPLLMFFILSYTFFWLLLIIFFVIIVGVLRVDMASLPTWLVPLLTIIGSWMPSVAAAVVTKACEGWGGVRVLFMKMLQFLLPARWYLAALIPLGLAPLAVAAYRISGGVPSGGVSLSPAFWAGWFAMNLLTGPTGEEPGWRGFALPRLLKKFKPLPAGLLLGLLWSFWHLPLWLTSGFTPDILALYVFFFITGVISLTLLMTWIYLKTPNSLVPMTIIHFTYNGAVQLISPAGFGLGQLLPLFGWMAGLCCVAALIVWRTGGLNDQKTINNPLITS